MMQYQIIRMIYNVRILHWLRREILVQINLLKTQEKTIMVLVFNNIMPFYNQSRFIALAVFLPYYYLQKICAYMHCAEQMFPFIIECVNKVLQSLFTITVSVILNWIIIIKENGHILNPIMLLHLFIFYFCCFLVTFSSIPR